MKNFERFGSNYGRDDAKKNLEYKFEAKRKDI